MTKPLNERIARLKDKKEVLAARLTSLEARAKKDGQKRELRRKILVGAAVIAQIPQNDLMRALVRDALRAAPLRESERTTVADLMG